MSLWDFLFPPVCPNCGSSVLHQGDWCPTCFNDLLHIRHVPDTVLTYIDDVCILSEYKGGMKSILYDVKFNGKKEQSKGAAPFLASYNLYKCFHTNTQTYYDYIIPVPSSHAKKVQRGYNQVDLFFQSWTIELHNTYSGYFNWLDCMYKFDTSHDMWSLTNKERHNNIEDAFMMHHDYKTIIVENKRILIVDDIYTTGATVEAVAKILRMYNPLRIDVVTLASGTY